MWEIKQIDTQNRAYYFYNDIIDLRGFDARLLKLAKYHTKTSVFTTLDILQLKQLMIVRVFIV